MFRVIGILVVLAFLLWSGLLGRTLEVIGYSILKLGMILR